MTTFFRPDLGPWLFTGVTPDQADIFLAKLEALQLSVGVAATGLITCTTKANMADSDYITIGNGIGVPVK